MPFSTARPVFAGRECCTAELHPKKVGVEVTCRPAKNQPIQADRHICAARPGGHRKSPEFRYFGASWLGPGMTAKRASGTKRRLKGAPGPLAGGVDRTPRQWHSANHWSRHDRCCWGRTGFQQLGGGAGRAGTFEVCRPLLAGPAFSFKSACLKPIKACGAFLRNSEREARGWHCGGHRRKPVTSGKRRFAIWLLHRLSRPGRR